MKMEDKFLVVKEKDNEIICKIPFGKLKEYAKGNNSPGLVIAAGDKVYLSKGMSKHRMQVFKKNPCCVSCGLRGTTFFAIKEPNKGNIVIELYGKDHADRWVELTIDHILPVSKGGKNEFKNYQTMCSVCNNRKGNREITPEELKNEIFSERQKRTRRRREQRKRAKLRELGVYKKAA